MKTNMNYQEARDLLLTLTKPLKTETAELCKCSGRILAADLCAAENVPAFDRSPYDGYALRAEDTENASREHPLVLQILEEIPAGNVPTKNIVPGTAAKILTGAPIPEGATAVIMYEKTEFTAEMVKIFETLKNGDNIVRAGEDVKKGELLAGKGSVIDPGLLGTLAAQGIAHPEVYKEPLVGIISTGSELVDVEEEIPEGKIRNSNRYTFTAALQKDRCKTEFLGIAGDSAEEIAYLIAKGLEMCDMLLLTGGVSAGDYDLTPQAMEMAGCELLVKGVQLKPGMACCFGTAKGKLVCALSGNPSSALTNYYAVVQPAVKKMTGLAEYLPEEITLTLGNAFRKKVKGVRLLKGRLKIENGKAVMYLPSGQGNVMISSSIGCDVMAIVSGADGPLEAGTEVKGFLV